MVMISPELRSCSSLSSDSLLSLTSPWGQIAQSKPARPAINEQRGDIRDVVIRNHNIGCGVAANAHLSAVQTNLQQALAILQKNELSNIHRSRISS